MHAIDERLALIALATTDIEFAILAYLLRTWKRLQSCHDVATGVARHHHVECIHRLKVLTFAKTEGAGRHDNFTNCCGAFAHADGKIG